MLDTALSQLMPLSESVHLDVVVLCKTEVDSRQVEA